MPQGTHFVLLTKMPVIDVSRRFTVDKNMTFDELHFTLQTLYEWEFGHLHRFATGRGWGKDLFEEPDDDKVLGVPEDVQSEREMRPLTDHFKKVGDSLTYHYDFGDSWEVLIQLKQIVATPVPPHSQDYPTNISGHRAPPPEDCRWELEAAVRGTGGLDSFLDPRYVLPLDTFEKAFRQYFPLTVTPSNTSPAPEASAAVPAPPAAASRNPKTSSKQASPKPAQLAPPTAKQPPPPQEEWWSVTWIDGNEASVTWRGCRMLGANSITYDAVFEQGAWQAQRDEEGSEVVTPGQPWPPTVKVQRMQKLAHRNVLPSAAAAGAQRAAPATVAAKKTAAKKAPALPVKKEAKQQAPPLAAAAAAAAASGAKTASPQPAQLAVPQAKPQVEWWSVTWIDGNDAIVTWRGRHKPAAKSITYDAVFEQGAWQAQQDEKGSEVVTPGQPWPPTVTVLYSQQLANKDAPPSAGAQRARRPAASSEEQPSPVESVPTPKAAAKKTTAKKAAAKKKPSKKEPKPVKKAATKPAKKAAASAAKNTRARNTMKKTAKKAVKPSAKKTFASKKAARK